MKNLLVPTEANESMRSVLEAALLVARRFDSYVEGFALRPAVPDYVPIDMVSGLTWHADDRADAEAVTQARAVFSAFVAERGLSAAGASVTGASFNWLDDAPAGDTFISGYSRVFDMTVVGRPTQGQPSPSLATLEAALFESGRPILIVPPSTPAALGETIVIVWNGSTETARTIAFAKPFLRRAGRVIVLTVESGMVPGPTGEQLARALRRDGLKAEAITAPKDARNPGEVALEQTRLLGGDLVIKGAYTQSRLRQMIFGGATNHILNNTTFPVLMAH
jgi:nucleotide-binding universal stress UspA family protein